MDNKEATKQGDLGTKVRIERGEIEIKTDHNGTRKAKVKSNSVLEELFNKKKLSQDNYSAGLSLYHDWYYGVSSREGALVQAYDPKPEGAFSPTSRNYSDWQMQRWESYHNAINCLEGIGKKIAEAVCCNNYTIRECEELYNLPNRYTTPRLREALDTLSNHYTNNAKKY